MEGICVEGWKGRERYVAATGVEHLRSQFGFDFKDFQGLTLTFIWVTWKLLWSSVDRMMLARFLPLSVRNPVEDTTK